MTQTKRPMAELNELVGGQLAQISTIFLAKMLQEKTLDNGVELSDVDARLFAEQLQNNPKKHFAWDDGKLTNSEISIELLQSDFKKLAKDIEDFQENELPEILEKISGDTADIILKSLHRDWPKQKKHELKNATQFRKNLEEDWGEAFDILRMMTVISREIGQECIDWAKENAEVWQGTKFGVLIKLHARGCQVASEIVCLIENGYADGAFARWRTLHEISVVATLLADNEEQLAQRYLDHVSVEAKREMDKFKVHYETLGYSKPSDSEIEEIERGYQKCLEDYGHKFGSQYGWAHGFVDSDKPTFLDLENAIGQLSSHSYYKFASQNVHASSKGILFRLGLLDQEDDTLLAGMSNIGFYEPAHNLAHTLLQLNTALVIARWDIDTIVEIQILKRLRDAVHDKFPIVQDEIERRHFNK